MTSLAFPETARPLVSVVMVTYGAWPWVERSLHALGQHTWLPYEVIVVDNASPDGTGDQLQAALSGATLVRNDDNVGFGRASTQGALHALGRHVCFLNSDTLVLDGWLEPLVEVLEGDPTVGAVVPRKLNLDGTLQEACSVLDRIGRVHLYGAGGDPSHPAYRFRRRADFGGAACLLVRRALFLDVGGFDPDFEGMYFEDADLCFALRHLGADTVYEPRSKVCHAGGASGATEQLAGYAVRNHARFMAKWGHALAYRPELPDSDAPPHQLIAARDAQALDRVLLVDDNTAGLARLAQKLARTWPLARVTLVSPATTAPEELLEAGVEVVVAPDDLDRWLDDRLFHYGVVVAGGSSLTGELTAAVRRSQPQALLVADVADVDAGRDELLAAMSRMGVAPPPPARRHDPSRSLFGGVVRPKAAGVTIGPPRAVSVNGVDGVEADVAGQPVWFTSEDAPLRCSADAFLAAVLMLSLHAGVTLEVHGDVSPRLVAGTRAIGDLVRRWWGVGPPVPVLAVPTVAAAPIVVRERSSTTALCFSGGVDSFFTLLRGPRPVDLLVYVHGYDIPLADTRRMEQFETDLRAVGAGVGAGTVVLRTNLLQHPLTMAVTWERSHGGAIAAAGHLLADRVGRLLISSSFPYEYPEPWGTHWDLDPLWSSERLEVEHVGAERWRADKLRAIAGEPLVQRYLRVCHENRSATRLNCSECEKCVRTQLTLAGCGRLAEFTVFDHERSLVERVDGLGTLRSSFYVEIYRRLLGESRLDEPVRRAVERLVERSATALARIEP